MEAWQRRHIETNKEELSKLTVVDAIFESFLIQGKVLEQAERDMLKCTKTSFGDVAYSKKLLELLTTKSGAYDILMCALKSTNKSGALKLLQQPYKPILFDMDKPAFQFFGRAKELNKLHDCFYRSRTEPLCIYDCFTVISGMAGIGKTELCRKFCENILKHDPYMNLAWINGETETSIAISYENFAKQLYVKTHAIDGMKRDFRDIAKDIFLKLSGFKFTFIFDNVDNIQSIKNFLHVSCLQAAFNQMNGNLHILMTSRSTNWDRELQRQNCLFLLDTMEPNEAVSWVCTKVRGTTDGDIVDINLLLEKLQYYTLAIQQAISYINIRNQPIHDYLQNFFKLYDVLNFDMSQFDKSNPYRYTTFTTFMKSIDYVLEQNGGDLAFKYLSICAYLAPDNISRNIFSSIQNCDTNNERAIMLLVDTSLLKCFEGRKLSMHRMLQEFVRWGLSKGFTNPGSSIQKTIQNIELRENHVLKHLVEGLNSSNWPNQMEHATNIWKFSSNHTDIIKTFYDSSLYGRLKLTPLHLLTEQGDVDAALQLLRQMKQTFSLSKVTQLVNQTDNCTRTSAFIAASLGNTMILRELASFNANLQIRSTVIYAALERINNPCYWSTYWNSMHMAAYNSHLNTVEYLDQADPDLGQMLDNFYESPALIAARFGYLDIVKSISSHLISHEICALIKRIADGLDKLNELQNVLQAMSPTELDLVLNSKLDKSTLTILRFSVRVCATTETLDLLLDKGAEIGKYGTSFEILYQEVAINDSVVLFNWLIKENLKLEGCVKMYTSPKENWTPFFDAAKYGSLNVMKSLIDCCTLYNVNLDINESDQKGDTPIYQAAYQGHLPVVKFLVEKGANVNCLNKWGSIPIIAAALRANFDVVLYLASLSETEFWPSKIPSGNKTLIGMLNLSVVHAVVAHDSVEITERLLCILKQRQTRTVGLFCGLDEFRNETITLISLAAFYGSANVIKHLMRNYAMEMEKNPKLNVINLLNSFMSATNRGCFNMPNKMKHAANFLIGLANVLPKQSLIIYPSTMVRLLDHKDCFELFDDVEQITYLSKIIYWIITPTLRYYQRGMKDYLSIHGGKEMLAGDQVQEMVIKTFLGWTVDEMFTRNENSQRNSFPVLLCLLVGMIGILTYSCLLICL